MATRVGVIGLALSVALGVTWRGSVAQQTTPPPPASAASPTAKASEPKAPEPGATAPAVVPPLDVQSLERQLKDTKAIGVFTKMALKNRVDDLLEQLGEYHRGKAKRTLKDLRRAYRPPADEGALAIAG